ncbi:MAG TPA: FMN-binding negative transcriptional regulator, partial [Bdellovibrionota bacterium]|nr:FMN-binding negative transcriptional regulator [Bdellovibrionota bacterium]
TRRGDEVACGVFNHVRAEGKLYLHLNRRDEQVACLRESDSATLVFQDILAVIPSYWVDEKYAGAATTYYRYAELRCRARVLESDEELTRVFRSLMGRYQPEGRHEPLSPDSATYRSSYAMLSVVELEPLSVRTKWKIGQNRPVETRLKVAAELEKRAQGQDLRAAAEIRKWIAAGGSSGS